MGITGVAKEGGMNGRRGRAKMEISREEERAAVASRSIDSLLLKLTLLALIVLGLLLASLPALPSLALLRDLMPPVAFYGVWTRRRVRERGRRKVVAAMVRSVTVPRGEGGGAEGRQRRRGGGRAGRGGGEDRRGFVEGAGSDQGRIDLERECEWKR